MPGNPTTPKSDNLLDSLKELEHSLSGGSHHGGVEHQPTVLPSRKIERPKPALDAGQPTEHAPVETTKPLEEAFDKYKQVDEDHPDESPYVIKQAKQKKDDVMTDDANKSDSLIQIEDIMADGLGDAFKAMTSEQQQTFKIKGEEVARTIDDLTRRFKLTAKKVLHLIRDWLKLIPGVNKFFLEQEAKIKTDDILRYSVKYTKSTKP